jgi:acetyltransferase-like isoleucine patch superfamily enzyme
MGIIKKALSKLLLKRNPIKWAKKNGVNMGENCRITGPTTFGSEPYLVTIGNHVCIAGADFITHDGAVWVLRGLNPDIGELVGYGRITVEDNVFIGKGTTILRGVTIGQNTVVGAKSLVNKSLEPNSVYAGVPAKRICSIYEFRDKFLADMPEFDLENYRKNKKDEVLKMVDKFKKR